MQTCVSRCKSVILCLVRLKKVTYLSQLYYMRVSKPSRKLSLESDSLHILHVCMFRSSVRALKDFCVNPSCHSEIAPTAIWLIGEAPDRCREGFLWLPGPHVVCPLLGL